MKKDYEAPKAEKMDFNYEEVVVASTSNCRTGGEYSEWGDDCHSNTSSWKADVTN